MSSTTFELNTKIFRAGAGAGKTTSLIKEVYDFYHYFRQQYDHPPRIVLTTFTRKATQEMRERLMLKAQEVQDHDFLNFVLSKNNLHISTIHGVLQIFLKQFGYMIDLDPGFSIVSHAETVRSASRIMKNIVCANKEGVLEDFEFKGLVQNAMRYYERYTVNPELRAPTQSDFNAAMTVFLLDLQQESNLVAKEILNQTIDQKYVERAKYILTVAKELELYKWLENRDKIIHSTQDLPSVRRSSKNPQITDELDVRMKSLVKSLQSLESSIYDPEIWEQQINLHSILQNIFKEFSDNFFEYKCSSGQLAMADLETLSYKLLKTRPDALADFSEQWNYWLIDEFQDTSPLQVSILDHLINKKPHFIVGDPQQSIYFFRGARQDVFFNKQKEIEHSKGILKNLSVNYRATPNLMLFVNDMFSDMKFMEMTTPATAQEQDIPAAFFVSHADLKSETESIVEYIMDLLSKNVRYEDIAVIARKNYDLVQISNVLSERKIPYYLHSATGYGSRREILDALSLLKFLVHPFDNKNLISLLRSPWFHVSDNDLASNLKPKEYFWNLLTAAYKVNSNKLEAIGRLLGLLEYSKTIGISRAFEKGVFDSGLLDASFVYDPSGRREANIWKLLVQLRTEEHRPGFNYLHFIQSFQKAEDVSDEHADAISSVEPNRVNLMTVHVSKGLEFKYVILPFVSKMPQQTRTPQFLVSGEIWNMPVKLKEEAKNVLPLTGRAELQKIQEEELEENKRLLYVAATRAKQQLFISYSGEAKKNSWLSYLNFPLVEGENKKQGYSFVVSSGYKKESSHIGFKSAMAPKIKERYLDFDKWVFNKPKQSVSQIIDDKESISPDRILQILKKSERGIYIHRLFELLHYEGENGALEIARNWSKEIYQQFLESIDFLKTQTQVPLMQIIQNGKVEWGFVLKGSESDIEGQVDLWGVIDNELWIIDYKTGDPSSREKAFKQLEVYSLAVQEYVGAKKTNLCALFPGHKIIDVRLSPLLQELKDKFKS